MPRNDKLITGETIWITGATSGIGYSLALAFANNHNTVIISGRNKDKLNEMTSMFSSMRSVQFDVTSRHEIDRVKNELALISPTIDRVILAAGNCEYLSFKNPENDDENLDIVERIMQVNLVGMVNCIHAALGLLKNANNPHIVGICSLASEAPFPRAEAYGASKAAAKYLLESLRIDLGVYNIDVTTILPGFVDTPLTRKNNFSMPFLMSADTACKRILGATSKRKMHYAFPKRLAFILWLARLFPRTWLRQHLKTSK